MRKSVEQEQEYTREELEVLAMVHRSSGRTCDRCEWYRPRGAQKGCFPDGKYRKWLSQLEYESGCGRFRASR